MKALSKQHKKFIDLVAGGATFGNAYATICNNKTTSANARSNGSKLAKKYAELIQSEREKLQKAISQATESNAVKEALKTVISRADRLTTLSEAASDLINKAQGKTKSTFFSGGKIMQSHNGEIFMLPVDTQVKLLEAARGLLAELNKMDGSYAATKTEIDVNQPFIFKVGYSEEDE